MASPEIVEHAALFSGRMVRAILDGRKTQTRRTVQVGNSLVDGLRWNLSEFLKLDFDGASAASDLKKAHAGSVGPILHTPLRAESEVSLHRVSPAWLTGHRFWVREIWSVNADLYQVRRAREAGAVDPKLGPYFQADEGQEHSGLDWRRGVHMPRWASRVTLEITGTRVERLQDISTTDCAAEGITGHRPDNSARAAERSTGFYRNDFHQLWDKINGRGSWNKNPWVWVFEFRRLRR